jgi:hypothetical protein
MRRAAWIALFLAAGCASSASGPQPEIELAQTSVVADAARHVTGGMPVQFRISIRNTLATPITLKRVELQSVGGGAYTLAPVSRTFDQVIAVGGVQTIDLWGPATAEQTISGANGPVTIRATAQFDAPGGSFQTVVMRQVHANVN